MSLTTQQFLKYITYILAGFLCFGAILGTINNAVALIPLHMACWGTGIIILIWGFFEFYVRKKGIKWIFTGKKEAKITSINIKIRLFFIGFIIVLWTPTVLSIEFPIKNQLTIVDLTKDKTINFMYGTYQLEGIYQTINFIVANTGENEFVLDRVSLEIGDLNPYYVTEFPQGPLAPQKIREYEVSISPARRHYLVTDENTVYKPGDVEEFYVELKSSDRGFIYEVLPGIEWFNLVDPKIRKKTNLTPRLIDFPGVFRLSDILKLADKIDYFLDSDVAVNSFIKMKNERGDSQSQFFRNYYEYTNLIPKRFLIDNRENGLNISEKQNLDIRKFAWSQIEYINHSYYRATFFSALEEIKNVREYYTVSGAQYLILYGLKGSIKSDELIIEMKSQRAIVIQHTCCAEAEIVWKTKDVELYINHFEQFWQLNKANELDIK